MNLHDATLRSLFILWGQRQARIELIAVGVGEVQIVADGLVALDASRRDPWGPSAQVLDAVGPMRAGPSERLVLRMQSGDDLVIEAAHISMPEPSGSN